MNEKFNWIKQNLRIITSLAIVFLGGVGLILSSSLMYSHGKSTGSLDFYGNNDSNLSGGVMVSVYAVDPNQLDMKGQLLHSEITEDQHELNFTAPEDSSPPYLIEFHTVNKSAYIQKTDYIN